MKAEVDPKDRQFLSRLHRIGGGTIQEICADHGVTATAVRQRLMRLEAFGLIERETVRAGRGRPHFVYKPTDDGLRELGENYAGLAVILWKAIQQIDDPSVREVVMGNVRNEMAGRYGRAVQGESVEQRLQQLGEGLEADGFDVEVDNSGLMPILRENNCPYLDLATADPEICRLEQEVFEQILGERLELSQCSRDGSNCCEFHVTREAS